MAAKIGDAPVSVLPDTGHLSNIENAEAFKKAIEWLAPRASLAPSPDAGQSNLSGIGGAMWPGAFQ
jgi:hypothetical protein